jgi:uncharacterized low-complexity protein
MKGCKGLKVRLKIGRCGDLKVGAEEAKSLKGLSGEI